MQICRMVFGRKDFLLYADRVVIDYNKAKEDYPNMVKPDVNNINLMYYYA